MTERSDLVREFTEQINRAIGSHEKLEGVLAKRSVDYLARRAADRTIKQKFQPTESLDKAYHNTGELIGKLQAESEKDRISLNNLKSLVEEKKVICGIYPFC